MRKKTFLFLITGILSLIMNCMTIDDENSAVSIELKPNEISLTDELDTPVYKTDILGINNEGMYTVRHWLYGTSFHPKPVAQLSYNERVSINFSYMTDEPAGVRIFARPYSNGSPAPYYYANTSPLYPAGHGIGQGFFTITEGNIMVDQVVIMMYNADMSVELMSQNFNVEYHFGTSIANVKIDPDASSQIEYGETINVSYTYQSQKTHGITIFARPFAQGKPITGYKALDAKVITQKNGSATSSFTLNHSPDDNDPLSYREIDQVRISVFSKPDGRLVYEKCIDVSYRFYNPFEWTMLVYMAGDTTVNNSTVKDLEEMSRGYNGSNKIRILAFVHGDGSDKENGSKYVRIEKGSCITEKNIDKVNKSNPKVLKQFVKYGAMNYPAKRYCLVIWNHGGGIEKKLIPGGTMGFAYDNYSQDSISISGLADSLKYAMEIIGRKIDVLGIDASFMGMAEIAAEVSDYANFFAASQTVIPGNGWDYERITHALSSYPGISPWDFAMYIGKAYDDSYPNWDSLTFSVIDLSQMYILLAALNRFAEVAVTISPDYIQKALKNSIKFHYLAMQQERYYVDLADFANNVDIAESDALINALQSVVIFNFSTVGNVSGDANGLSIYADDVPSDLYRTFRIPRLTEWDELLDHIYKNGE